MELKQRQKKRGAYAGASKTIIDGKGANGREYTIEQTLKGWEVEIHNNDFFVASFIFDRLQKAKSAAIDIEAGIFDPQKARDVRRGVTCFQCGSPTNLKLPNCPNCGTLKPWIYYKD